MTPIQPATEREALPELPEPSMLKLPDDDLDDDIATKWAWMAHGYDTGMQPYFTDDQMRDYAIAATTALKAEVEQYRADAERMRRLLERINQFPENMMADSQLRSDVWRFLADTIARAALKETQHG